jgi:hypothetical protein
MISMRLLSLRLAGASAGSAPSSISASAVMPEPRFAGRFRLPHRAKTRLVNERLLLRFDAAHFAEQDLPRACFRFFWLPCSYLQSFDFIQLRGLAWLLHR